MLGHFLKIIVVTLAAIFIVWPISAEAQRGQQHYETLERTTVRDVSQLAGHWRIEVIDRPDSAFKGEATIPLQRGDRVEIELITEDRCCGGNYARVLMRSQLILNEGRMDVYSQIERYLIREEPNPASYSPDNFALRRVSKNVLEGKLNGYVPVRWIRGEAEIS